MDEKPKNILEKQLELLFEKSQQSCDVREIAEATLAMAEIAKILTYPLYFQLNERVCRHTK